MSKIDPQEFALASMQHLSQKELLILAPKVILGIMESLVPSLETYTCLLVSPSKMLLDLSS